MGVEWNEKKARAMYELVCVYIPHTFPYFVLYKMCGAFDQASKHGTREQRSQGLLMCAYAERYGPCAVPTAASALLVRCVL
jgi:hypothetical protein